jgi:hypothetical protein
MYSESQIEKITKEKLNLTNAIKSIEIPAANIKPTMQEIQSKPRNKKSPHKSEIKNESNILYRIGTILALMWIYHQFSEDIHEFIQPYSDGFGSKVGKTKVNYLRVKNEKKVGN